MSSKHCKIHPWKQDFVWFTYFHSRNKNGTFPAGIYLSKVNNRETRKRCEICSRLTIKYIYILYIYHIYNIYIYIYIYIFIYINKHNDSNKQNYQYTTNINSFFLTIHIFNHKKVGL